MLAAQLSIDMQSALLNAVFKTRGWILRANTAEVAQALVALNLVREVSGDYQVTVAGMSVRAMLARKARQNST